MWTRQLLKENGMTAFKRNYWTCVAVSVIAMLLGGISSGGLDFDFEFDFSAETGELKNLMNVITPGMLYIFGVTFVIMMLLALCINILVSNVVAVGCSRYFMENREHKTDMGQLFYAFREGRYGTTVWIMFWKNLYIFAWSLLLIIPGIMKSYSYLLVPYILAENPNLEKDRIFELSSEMMEGHRWEAFVLSLSFIGWQFLGAISYGLVNIFYTNPYIQATFAEFYSAVKAEATQKGIIMEGELPGVVI